MIIKIILVSTFSFMLLQGSESKNALLKSSIKSEYIVKRALEEDKIIIIEAISTDCRHCVKMDKEVMTEKNIEQAIKKDFIMLFVNIDKEKLPFDLNVTMTPTFFFVFPNFKGSKVKTKRVPGAWSKEDFLDILRIAKRTQKEKK